jgi:hypothetical protein
MNVATISGDVFWAHYKRSTNKFDPVLVTSPTNAVPAQ